MRAKSVNPLDEIRTIFSYYSAYRKIRPDLALHWTVKPDIYGSVIASFMGIPVANNVSGLGAAFESESPLALLVRSLYRFAFRKARRVFFQNTDDRRP